MSTIRIGGGAGFSGDRIDPAVELAERGDLDFLVFECLAERTIALAQQAKSRDATAGYDPMLEARLRAVLPACRRLGIRIITNMGAANPAAAATAARACARELGLHGLEIATISGDDVLDRLRAGDLSVEDADRSLDEIAGSIVAANVYIGAEPISEALARGADLVITGRAADPSLFLAAQQHAFKWRADDWTRLGAGTAIGHLLECAGQLTGGYFADPGFKEVEDLDRLGFPIAEVSADGTAVLTKVRGSGGTVTRQTCKEQLLYEVHDPAVYVTPDVTADFSGISFSDAGDDRVRIRGASGRARPDRLKVSIGYFDGFIGEGQLSYAGPGALRRGRLAVEILSKRLARQGYLARDLRFDVIGGDERDMDRSAHVRIRVAARAPNAAAAGAIGNEVEALYTNGPAGGGGAFKSTREVLAVASAFVARESVRTQIEVTSA